MCAHDAVCGKALVGYLSSVYSAPQGKCKSHLRSPTKIDSKRYLERDQQSLLRRLILYVHDVVHYNVQPSSVWICVLGLDTQVVIFWKHNVISAIHYHPDQKIQEGIRKPVFNAHLLSKIIHFKSIPLTHPDKKCETVFQVKILTLFHSLKKSHDPMNESAWTVIGQSGDLNFVPCSLTCFSEQNLFFRSRNQVSLSQVPACYSLQYFSISKVLLNFLGWITGL